MSKMTILLIRVWDVSVIIAFMVLHAVQHFGMGLWVFLKLVSCSEYRENCVIIFPPPIHSFFLLNSYNETYKVDQCPSFKWWNSAIYCNYTLS